MKKLKRIGIWMDHSTAHIMILNDGVIRSSEIKCKFTHQEKEESLSKSEDLMHNKEQHEQASFYKTINAVILDYDEVILFGPTDAKAELLNIIQNNHLYDKIKMEAIATDKMTQHEMDAFVLKHFAINN